MSFYSPLGRLMFYRLKYFHIETVKSVNIHSREQMLKKEANFKHEGSILPIKTTINIKGKITTSASLYFTHFILEMYFRAIKVFNGSTIYLTDSE